MKDRIKGFLRKGASAAINTELARGQLLELANNSVLGRYAVAEDLNLDLQARRAAVMLRLLGEVESIEVVLHDFEIVERPGAPGLAIRISRIQVDREWMQRLANDHIVGSLFPIPAAQTKWAARLQSFLA